MKYKKLYITIVSTAVFLTSINAQEAGVEPVDITRVGLSGWQFLRLNGSASQAGMAGAFTAAYEGDVNDIFGNPSGLAEVENIGVAFNQVSWIADIGYQSFAVAKKYGGGVVGLSFVSLDYGTMDETINSTVTGETRTEAVVTGNTFTAGDVAVGISYARKVTDRLSIGGNYRLVTETIADLSMNNYSFDIGTTYYTGFKSLRLSMVARNFGPDVNLTGWSEELQTEPVDIKMPVDFRVGLAIDLLDDESLTYAIEFTHPNDGPEKINVGARYIFNKMLTLRGGYRANYDEEGLTFGAGFNLPLGGMATRIDYAFVDFGRLQQVHMVSIGLSL